jgi:hypothetical protein
MDHRKNESVMTRFRAHRIFRVNELWYFHTREGIDVGPFSSEFEAQIEASILKHLLNEAPTPAAAIAAIREFVLDARSTSCDLKGLTDYVHREGRF